MGDPNRELRNDSKTRPRDCADWILSNISGLKTFLHCEIISLTVLSFKVKTGRVAGDRLKQALGATVPRI